MSSNQRKIHLFNDETSALPIPNLAAFSSKGREATKQLCAQIDNLVAAGQMPELKQRWESAGPEEKKVIATGMIVGMVAEQGKSNGHESKLSDSLPEFMGIHIPPSNRIVKGKRSPLMESLKSEVTDPNRWIVFTDPDGVSAPKDDKSE